MDFRDWFDEFWRLPGEALIRAIHRLSIETGLSWQTVRRAYLGARVYPETAHKLAKTAGGMIDAVALMDRPRFKTILAQRALGAPR